MGKQRVLRGAALLGPGIIAVTFETIRHAYLDVWLTEAQGNVITGSLVIGASALLLTGIFRRLDRTEAVTRRVQSERAALEERGRIAADLHDDVGQSLFYLNVKLNEAQRLLEEAGGTWEARSDALPLFDDMRRALRQLDGRLRGTISELKAADARDDAEFTEAVGRRLAEFEARTGIPVIVGEVSHRCGPDCPGAEHELLRLLQEALANVSRHARANQVKVSVRSETERDVLIVEDDGIGFDLEAVPGVDEGHFGLTLMGERAATLGGELRVESRPGRGTAVRFERVHRPAAGDGEGAGPSPGWGGTGHGSGE